MPRRPFNIVAAVFYLLAGVIAAQIVTATLAGLGCFYMNANTVREIGACMPIAQLIQSQWDKIFETALALLIAGNAGRLPPPSGPPTSPD